MMDVDVAIVGSGPCGLGAAWRSEQLRAAGVDIRYLVVDERSDAGGTASSVTTSEGFTFDYGGHVLYVHPHYEDVRRVIDESVPAWHESLPIRGVWTHRRLVPYPVQRNIHRLPARTMIRSLVGLGRVAIRRRLAHRFPASRTSRDDLETHLHSRFGRGLTHAVLGPLNRKMWAHEPHLLESSWTRLRSGSGLVNVPDASIRQILRSLATRRDNPGWSADTRVRYPLHGGSAAIWRGIARTLPSERRWSAARVVRIEADARELVLHDGRRVCYGSCISTIPLDILLRLVTDRPHLAELARDLRYSRAHIIGFGVRGTRPAWLAGVHSFHVPQHDIPCWRISFPAAFSPGNVPPGEFWSILCETSAPGDGGRWDVTPLQAAIERKLIEQSILPSAQAVVSRWEATLEHGYPVPFLGRDAVLRRIHEELAKLGILSRGRFGGWKYEVSNQDHAFMQGVEAIDYLVDRRIETTYAFPDAVN